MLQVVITKCVGFCKVRQVLQSVAVVTNRDITPASHGKNHNGQAEIDKVIDENVFIDLKPAHEESLLENASNPVKFKFDDLVQRFLLELRENVIQPQKPHALSVKQVSKIIVLSRKIRNSMLKDFLMRSGNF